MLALAGQIAGFAALVALHLRLTAEYLQEGLDPETGLAVLVGFSVQTAALLGIPVVALFAIYTILRRWRSAWVNAVLVQGLSLALGVALYFRSRPFYTYLILLYAVAMVVYLMLPASQAAFVPPASLPVGQAEGSE
jgi:hypothetical protein